MPDVKASCIMLWVNLLYKLVLYDKLYSVITKPSLSTTNETIPPFVNSAVSSKRNDGNLTKQNCSKKLIIH